MPLLGNPAGTPGICYDIYQMYGFPEGASIIFENGRYDGFSEGEQILFLEKIKDVPFHYEFTHVIHLGRDFKAGVFDILKEQVKEKKHNYSK